MNLAKVTQIATFNGKSTLYLLFITFAFSLILSGCGGKSSNTDSSSSTPNPVKKSKPNVVVILTDDMRWDLMSVLNHPYLDTPNMDQLASEGVLFENSFIPIPVCSPSRAGLLTGKDPHRASAPRIVWRNNSFLETQTPFPVYLHQHGYTTGYFGKWHLGDGKIPKTGFDQWESFDWLGDFTNTTLWINGHEKRFQGFADDIISQRASDFISQQAGEKKPFFVMVGLKQPHLPFESPARHASKFEGLYIPPPDTFNEDFSVSGKIYSPFLSFKDGPVGEKFFGSFENYIKKHYRAILGLDDALGKIINSLSEINELDNTIIIYTSDNGYSLGDHGLTEKHVTYEEPIRVPLLIRYPQKITAGSIKEEMVSNIDLAPTILDFAGIPIPKDMTGLSLKPLLENKEIKEPIQWRKRLFFWFENLQAAIRTERYKLVKSLSVENHFELYDLLLDPKETKNLYGHPDYMGLSKSMLQQFQEEANRIGWTQRKNRVVKRIYRSQAMSKDIATDLLRKLSTTKTDESPPVNGNIDWKIENARNEKFLFNDGSSVSPPTYVVAIPVHLSIDWDPFIALNLQGSGFKASLFSQGKVIWSNTEHGASLNYPNPPIKSKYDHIYLLLESISDDKVEFRLVMEAPDNTINLPLEFNN